MKISEIRLIFVVGAGTMGQQIALQCAVSGYDVTVYDISAQTLDTAKAQLSRLARDLVAQGRLDDGKADAALKRIGFTSSPEAAAQADLLSESAPEDPDLKAQVFSAFGKICKKDAIFTTNTSTLAPSLYAAATGRPDKFAALHFHLPVWEANLVDLMPHPGTSRETMALLYDFATSLGQVPLVFAKESPKYVVNAILDAMHTTAFRLMNDGVASAEDIDRAYMIVMKAKCGPFGNLDFVGLDTVWHIMQSQARLTGDPQMQAQADAFKKNYIDKGWLGAKSGRGFYTYPDPAYARPDFLTRTTNPFATPDAPAC
jgi:3-hydroxybutyryl-CoA dehydrogenase